MPLVKLPLQRHLFALQLPADAAPRHKGAILYAELDVWFWCVIQALLEVQPSAVVAPVHFASNPIRGIGNLESLELVLHARPRTNMKLNASSIFLETSRRPHVLHLNAVPELAPPLPGVAIHQIKFPTAFAKAARTVRVVEEERTVVLHIVPLEALAPLHRTDTERQPWERRLWHGNTSIYTHVPLAVRVVPLQPAIRGVPHLIHVLDRLFVARVDEEVCARSRVQTHRCLADNDLEAPEHVFGVKNLSFVLRVARLELQAQTRNAFHASFDGTCDCARVLGVPPDGCHESERRLGRVQEFDTRSAPLDVDQCSVR
mmetsp:Transcript_11632/g.31176  ORF Transcript_11632/g.31176 Transcript_11632/m.31176 type:complete len:316 (-) Transcript_11632:1721-2668(-)